MNRELTIGIAVLFFASPVIAQESISIEPGLWTHTNTMSGAAEMAGAPPITMPPRTTTSTECVTPENIEITPERLIRQFREDGDGAGDCQLNDVIFEGRTMTSTVRCIADGMSMAGDYTFEVAEDGQSANANVVLNGIADGMNVTSNFVLRGELSQPWPCLSTE